MGELSTALDHANSLTDTVLPQDYPWIKLLKHILHAALGNTDQAQQELDEVKACNCAELALDQICETKEARITAFGQKNKLVHDFPFATCTVGGYKLVRRRRDVSRR